MEMKEQVITLEQGKRLHELWFKRESRYRYNKNGNYPGQERYCQDEYYIEEADWESYSENYNAYTASELMEILPVELFVDEQEGEDNTMLYSLMVYKEDKYHIQYGNSDWESLFYQVWNENLTVALWDMFVWLLENNLLPDTTTEWA